MRLCSLPRGCQVAAPRRSRLQKVVANAMSVRPYTARAGDSISSIASKRGFAVDDIMKLNHELDPAGIKDGQTILIPAGKLSDRDKEILVGMEHGGYRTYPLRPGEKLDDVLKKRNITIDEFLALNPGVEPAKLQDNQIIKLPKNKYTEREREMLFGAGVPHEFFASGNTQIFIGGLVVGAMVFGAVSFAVRRAGDDERREFAELLELHRKQQEEKEKKAAGEEGPGKSAEVGANI